MVTFQSPREHPLSHRPAPRTAAGTLAGESWPRLLAQLAHALLRRGFDLVPIAVINRIIAGCSLFALVSPLLLWVSWSRTGFFIIMGSFLLAVGIIGLLVWLYPEDPF